MSWFGKKGKTDVLPPVEGEIEDEEVPLEEEKVRKTLKERWLDRKYRMWMSSMVVLETVSWDRDVVPSVYRKEITRMKMWELRERYPDAVHKSGEPGHYMRFLLGERRETDKTKEAKQTRITATDLKKWHDSNVISEALDSMGRKGTKEGRLDYRIVVAVAVVGIALAAMYVFLVLM